MPKQNLIISLLFVKNHTCRSIEPVLEISEISIDISSIYRVSVDIDTMYPSNSRSIEILDFFYNYRRYFVDISVFYQIGSNLSSTRPSLPFIIYNAKF